MHFTEIKSPNLGSNFVADGFILELALAELGGILGPVEHLREAMDAARPASDVSGLMLAYLGHSVTRREPLDLAELCRRLLPNLEAGMPAHVALKADLREPGPTIKANAEQVRQMLKNLVTNAWEAVGDVAGKRLSGVLAVIDRSRRQLQRIAEGFNVKAGVTVKEILA